MNNIIPTSLPEEQGIPSSSITHVIRRLERHQIPMHSLLIARHGHLVYEGYYAPYTKHTLHRMFSVTKSLVSLGIGCLKTAGILNLDDPICSYFPEYVPDSPHPWLTAMTIDHMLQMKSCFSKTTYDKFSSTENWVESFFITAPDHMPGTIFSYDTSASHVLCALIEKLTGKNLLTYLRGEFLDDLGFSQEAYILSDPFGVSMGGSGLMALPSDLLRIGLLLLHHGKDPADWQSPWARQLYPADYLEYALACRGFSLMNAPIPEEGYGYGCQFWRISHGGYACYGMGGQLILCYPGEDLVVVTTADTQDIKGGNQFIYDSIYEELFPTLSDEPVPLSPAQEELRHITSRLTLPVLPKLTDLSAPMGLLAMSSAGDLFNAVLLPDFPVRYELDSNESGFLALNLSEVSQTVWELTLEKEGKSLSYPFGFGHLESGIMEPYGQNYAASAALVDDHTLYIRFWLTDECMAAVHMQLCFTGEHITIAMTKTEETKFGEFQGVFHGYRRHWMKS